MSHLKTLLLALALLSFAACSSCEEPFEGPSPEDLPEDGLGLRFPECGEQQEWDRDGDRLSDKVELNNASEGYHNFSNKACDPDPSRAIGEYANGSLQGGINLPDRGLGYAHNYGTDGVDEDDWGTAGAISCIESVGRLWEGTGVKVGINDISKLGGGRFSGHSSHQIGLDIDVRYIRKDGENLPLDIASNPSAYDRASSRALIEDFVDNCDVQLIFVDLDNVGFDVDHPDGNSALYDARGHSNHFHVRLNPEQS